jgi:hypothetical protein
VAGERVEERRDVLLDVVEVERDAEVRVALGGDDALGEERVHERPRVGRGDADERAVLALPAWGGDRRAQVVEAREQPVDEAADVRLDRGYPDVLDDPHPGEARVDVRHGRRPGVEAPRVAGRRVVGDVHPEDVLVGEPAGLRREQPLV